MSLSSEAALMLLAVALYVYDTLVLLAGNEALLVRRGRRWAAVFGAFGWRLAGKEPCLPGLMAPHRQVHKLAWQFEAGVATAPRRRVEPRQDLTGLAICAWLSALTLFVLFPICLFASLATWLTLSVLALLYAVNLTALVLLNGLRRRQKVGLGKYLATAFECLICPPFCINLVRRACAWEGVDEDFLAASQRVLAPPAMAGVRAQCLLRLDEQIDFEDEESRRMAALQQTRKRLQSTMPTP